jgi:hypothetical protein
MSADKLDNGKLDEILERALKSYSEPVPADFSEHVLSRIKEAQEQRILAHVVLQQRLALTGCIALVAAAIVSAVFFHDAVTVVFRSIAVSLIEQGQSFIDGVPQAVGTVKSDWQFYMVLAGVFGFAVYALADLLMANGE